MIWPTDGLSRRDNLHGRSNAAGRRFRSDLYAVDGVERYGLFCRARNCPGQRFARIREDPRIVAGAAERDVELLTIDQLSAARRVDVDQNAIDRGTLAGMRGNGIAVIEMREKLQVQLRFPLTAEAERGIPTSRVDRADRCELPIGNAQFPVP